MQARGDLMQSARDRVGVHREQTSPGDRLFQECHQRIVDIVPTFSSASTAERFPLQVQGFGDPQTQSLELRLRALWCAMTELNSHVRRRSFGSSWEVEGNGPVPKGAGSGSQAVAVFPSERAPPPMSARDRTLRSFDGKPIVFRPTDFQSVGRSQLIRRLGDNVAQWTPAPGPFPVDDCDIDGESHRPASPAASLAMVHDHPCDGGLPFFQGPASDM